MPRIAYWDCFSGISGDMALGALVDAGLDLDQLRDELQKLDAPGWEIVATRDVRYGISGTKLNVETAPQTTHRHLSDIEAILGRSSLDDAVRERSFAVFRRLAEAEGAVHGSAPSEVHFHEVGALDAIVDIVGVVVGLNLLGVEQVYASALPLGSGWINAAHGQIPVPGPAVAHLLAAVRAPTTEDVTPFELVTPTGAALLAELASFQRPPFRLEQVGYGFGSRDTGRLNAVRLWVGETDSVVQTPPQTLEQVLLLQTNLDDQAGEQLAYASEQLFSQGALDVWWQPIGMKKARPATLLSVLCPLDSEAAMTDLLFRETSSLGVRRQVVERWVAEREIYTVTTVWGPIRVKVKRWRGAELGAAPEYEDCARAARVHGAPLHVVYAAAQRAFHEQRNSA